MMDAYKVREILAKREDDEKRVSNLEKQKAKGSLSILTQNEVTSEGESMACTQADSESDLASAATIDLGVTHESALY